MFDFHMHSRVSFDGHDTGEALARASLAAGLTEICFTDHLDYDPLEQMGILAFDTDVYNAEYDALFEKAQSCYDDAEQTAIYKDMQKNLTVNAANVYIQDLADLVAVRSNLTGLQFYPIYVLDLSTVRYVD